MPTDLQTTNIWLAVTAIAVALQTLFMFAAVIIGWRMYRKIDGRGAGSRDALRQRRPRRA